MINRSGEILDDVYPEASARTREAYDATLPEYDTTTDAITEFSKRGKPPGVRPDIGPFDARIKRHATSMHA